MPRLLAVSDRASLAQSRPGLELADWAAELDALGVGALQLRERDLSDRELFELATRVRRRFGGLLVINRRIDVALAAGAEGVHLPESGLPVESLRHGFGERVLLGRSVHDLEGVREARRAGADYVTLAPVWASPGKSEPVGIAVLARAAAEGLAVFALGGVDAARLDEVARCGAAGAAGIRMFQRADDVRRAVAAAAAAWDRPARPPRLR